MREGKHLQLGALALGVGLSLGVAAPALAEDIYSVPTPDGSQVAVSSTEQARVDDVVYVDPQVAFTEAFLACQVGDGISDCVEEVMQNIGLEEEVTETEDATPYNPIDDEGSETEVETGPVIDVNPPGA